MTHCRDSGFCCILLRNMTFCSNSWITNGSSWSYWVLGFGFVKADMFHFCFQCYGMSLIPTTWSFLLRQAFPGSQISVQPHFGWIRTPTALLHGNFSNHYSPPNPLETVLSWLCRVSFSAYTAKDLAKLKETLTHISGAIFPQHPSPERSTRVPNPASSSSLSNSDLLPLCPSPN